MKSLKKLKLFRKYRRNNRRPKPKPMTQARINHLFAWCDIQDLEFKYKGKIMTQERFNALYPNGYNLQMKPGDT